MQDLSVAEVPGFHKLHAQPVHSLASMSSTEACGQYCHPQLQHPLLQHVASPAASYVQPKVFALGEG